jgi:hypothetical protein
MTVLQNRDSAPLDPDPEIAADLLRLRDHLERGEVPEARVFVKELAAKWPDSKRVQHMAHVLKPPVAREVPSRGLRPLDRERDWLRAHRNEYLGCWIALYGDEVVAASPDLHSVLEVVRQTPGREDALIHLQPDLPKAE